jgi:hypothetical protein
MTDDYSAVIPMVAYEDGVAAMDSLVRSGFASGRECSVRMGGSATERCRRAKA